MVKKMTSAEISQDVQISMGDIERDCDYWASVPGHGDVKITPDNQRWIIAMQAAVEDAEIQKRVASTVNSESLLRDYAKCSTNESDAFWAKLAELDIDDIRSIVCWFAGNLPKDEVESIADLGFES